MFWSVSRTMQKGRMWLPLHWAVTLPAINLSDNQALFTSNPAANIAHADETRKVNPCHLTAETSIGNHSTIADLLLSSLGILWIRSHEHPST